MSSICFWQCDQSVCASFQPQRSGKLILQNWLHRYWLKSHLYLQFQYANCNLSICQFVYSIMNKWEIFSKQLIDLIQSTDRGVLSHWKSIMAYWSCTIGRFFQMKWEKKLQLVLHWSWRCIYQLEYSPLKRIPIDAIAFIDLCHTDLPFTLSSLPGSWSFCH